MKCKLCQMFYDKYPLQKKSLSAIPGLSEQHVLEHCTMGKVKCAFVSGEFSDENWNCMTLITLRVLCQEKMERERHAFSCRGCYDQSIGVLPIPEFDGEEYQGGFLVLSWYKERGRTDGASVVYSGSTEKLNLLTAERIIEEYSELSVGIIAGLI